MVLEKRMGKKTVILTEARKWEKVSALDGESATFPASIIPDDLFLELPTAYHGFALTVS